MTRILRGRAQLGQQQGRQRKKKTRSNSNSNSECKWRERPGHKRVEPGLQFGLNGRETTRSWLTSRTQQRTISNSNSTNVLPSNSKSGNSKRTAAGVDSNTAGTPNRTQPTRVGHKETQRRPNTRIVYSTQGKRRIKKCGHHQEQSSRRTALDTKLRRKLRLRQRTMTLIFLAFSG